jgi:hypothetical protein
VLVETDDPSTWEIVHVARGTTDPVAQTLGFDLGYWDGNHFSALCDVLVMPRWHPAPPEDFDGLRRHASRLNGHTLFVTAADASAFRDWYVTRPWAEEEYFPGEFQVIRVDVVAPQDGRAAAP